MAGNKKMKQRQSVASYDRVTIFGLIALSLLLHAGFVSARIREEEEEVTFTTNTDLGTTVRRMLLQQETETGNSNDVNKLFDVFFSGGKDNDEKEKENRLFVIDVFHDDTIDKDIMVLSSDIPDEEAGSYDRYDEFVRLPSYHTQEEEEVDNLKKLIESKKLSNNAAASKFKRYPSKNHQRSRKNRIKGKTKMTASAIDEERRELRPLGGRYFGGGGFGVPQSSPRYGVVNRSSSRRYGGSNLFFNNNNFYGNVNGNNNVFGSPPSVTTVAPAKTTPSSVVTSRTGDAATTATTTTTNAQPRQGGTTEVTIPSANPTDCANVVDPATGNDVPINSRCYVLVVSVQSNDPAIINNASSKINNAVNSNAYTVGLQAQGIQNVIVALPPSPPPTFPPTKAPTKPTKAPTRAPTKKPTKVPTRKPTKKPTGKPTQKPTKAPTRKPTKKPTRSPTRKPTKKPTRIPTRKPTKDPTRKPTKKPTKMPTSKPSPSPTSRPTNTPTQTPNTSERTTIFGRTSPTKQLTVDDCRRAAKNLVASTSVECAVDTIDCSDRPQLNAAENDTCYRPRLTFTSKTPEADVTAFDDQVSSGAFNNELTNLNYINPVFQLP